MSEILGTLFKYLVALLGVGAVVAVLYQVLGSNKTQNAIADMTQLQTNVQALYSGQPTFTSLTNAVAISGRLAPAGMISGSNLINAWSGNVTVAVNSANAARFDLTTASVPQDACAKVIGGQGSAVALSVNGTAYTPPMDAGAAVTACNQTANTIIFTYAH